MAICRLPRGLKIRSVAILRWSCGTRRRSEARAIFERYVRCLPTVKAWVRYAKFEARGGEFSLRAPLLRARRRGARRGRADGARVA